MIEVNLSLLKYQIKDLLDSNIKECSKTALHNLLGEIYDSLDNAGTVLIRETQRKG
jgi:hypothetical protein